MNKEQEKEFKNKLAKFWWTECFYGEGEVDFSKVDGSNNFNIIPQNSKGIIQMKVGEFLSIIDEVFKQAEKEETQRDLETVITLLEGNEERKKIVNFIKEYLVKKT